MFGYTYFYCKKVLGISCVCCYHIIITKSIAIFAKQYRDVENDETMFYLVLPADLRNRMQMRKYSKKLV